MDRKVFVSYKYADTLVKDLGVYEKNIWGQMVRVETKVRHYVDKLQEKIGKDNINLGEKDGESLADFSDTTIETVLKSKIRQCSITIVLVSKGMKTDQPEKDQWIPWEVSYSLRTVPNGNYTKQMNAIIGIINQIYIVIALPILQVGCLKYYEITVLISRTNSLDNAMGSIYIQMKSLHFLKP